MSHPARSPAFRASGHRPDRARARVGWRWWLDAAQAMPEQGRQGSKVRQRAPSTGAGSRSRMSIPDQGEQRRRSPSTARNDEIATAMTWHRQHHTIINTSATTQDSGHEKGRCANTGLIRRISIVGIIGNRSDRRQTA